MHKALFLDRDGVINKDYGYVHKETQLEFIDGILDICKSAIRRGYLIFIITNQSGIGRGYYSEEQFWDFMKVIQRHFNKYGINFTKIYFAPHYRHSQNSNYLHGVEFRKPNVGMIAQAQKEFNIDLKHSILIGDKQSDIQAGLGAKIGRNIFFRGQFTNIF
ncbi:MAG: D-glycero-D-manno-heptose 1,7-bisphosphate phosphatase [Candidatus Deianiraeaceae bacterium]|jgi:D-glycero-D-manno-heptose 1,7-bisphosphate phosphatase